MSKAKKYYNTLHKQNEEISRNLSGLFRATIITNGTEREPLKENVDIAKLGRCRVLVHALHDENTPIVELPWAELSSPYGGSIDTGFFFVPEINSTVFVMFVNGNSSAPVIMGSWWNYQARNSESPAAAYMDKNTEYPKNKVIRTKTGHMIEMDDSPLNKGIRITTSNGNMIHLEDSDDNTLNVHFEGDINYTCNGKFNLTVEDDINIKTKILFLTQNSPNETLNA